MLAIKDNRVVVEFSPGDYLLLEHVLHVAVAVIVVADVLLVKPGHGADFIGGSDAIHVPLGDHVLAVRVERGIEDENDVLENRVYLRIVLGGEQTIGELDGVLAAGDFGRMQTAIYMDDGFALFGEGLRFRVSEAAG